MESQDAVGTIIGVAGAILIFALILVVLGIIAKWKIFKKAGEEGYYSLIPFYNEYVFSKIVFGKGIYFLIEMGGALLAFIGRVLVYSQTKVVTTTNNITTTNITTTKANPFGMVLLIIGALITLAYTLFKLYRLAIVFGKSTLYGVVMSLSTILCCGIVGFIMYLIIAFGSDSDYIGTDEDVPPIEDAV